MDQFVRELLTADGSTFKNPAANYYRISRDPENSAETTAQLFLGVRMQCAKCHNHPLRALDAGRLLRLRRLLPAGQARRRGTSRTRRSSTPSPDGEVRQPRTGQVMKPKALGGPVLEDAKVPDRRDRLADVADRRRQPVLRQEPGQPRLVST